MNKKIMPWLLILSAVAAGLYLRIYPSLLPFFDKKAVQEVENEEAQAVTHNLADLYPQVDVMTRDLMARKVLAERLKADRASLRQRTAERAREMKGRYRDEKGNPYLCGIDSYYWERLLKNLMRRGQIGDREVNGGPYDDLVGQPIDPAMKKNAHVWLGLAFYKTWSLFDPHVPLERTLFYVPLVLSCVIGVFAFFVARKLGANDLGAFIASFAVNVSPFLVVRVASEWFDTDIYNVLFPLLIFGIFLYAGAGRRTAGRRVFLCALAGLFTACYASTWKGWWFVFDIMLLSGVLFLINLKQSQKEEALPPEILGHYGACLALFFGFGSILVVFFSGFAAWADCLVEPLRLTSILKVTENAMWPNVFLTVAELGRAGAMDVIRGVGGQLVFFGGLIVLLYVSLFEHALRSPRYGFGILCLVFWIVATFYTAMEAFRFTLLLVVPVGLAFGLAVAKCYEYMAAVFSKYLTAAQAVLARGALVALISLYPVVNIVDLYVRLSAPPFSMDDQWHGVLTKINKETPSDAVVDSWWDYGHWFTGVAGRRVLFDGMTQNTPYAYWMASALLTDNPREFTGILRMINGAGNKAVDELTQADRMDLSAAISLVRRCLAVDPPQARKYLEEALPPARAGRVLGLLFPKELPPVFFVVSYDMPAKISPISYIGNWDFSRVDLWFKHQRLSKDEFLAYAQKHYRLTLQEAQSRYAEIFFIDKKASRVWFSHFLDYYSPIGVARQDGPMLYFDNGLNVNTENWHAFVQDRDPSGRGVPQSIFYMDKGEFKEVRQEKPDLAYSAIIFKEKGEYKSLLCDTALARSMLIRMYFFEAEGLGFLKLFDKSVDEKGSAIYVYEIVWPADHRVAAEAPVKSKKGPRR
jgi:dolichyl-diphosphooligosaccharide--protein glycosyltransferase